MRPLLAIALLVAPMAAEAADPPPRSKPEADAALRRWVWEMQVQVIQIRVRHAQPPRSEPGDCVVTGVVQAVWRGDAFRPGMDVTVKVPCTSSAQLDRDLSPLGGVGIDPRLVMQATSACIHLRRNGALVWGDVGRSPGPCSYSTGYTPLDAGPLLLDPANAL